MPKGVAVSHRSICGFIDAFVEAFGIRDDDVIGNQAPFDFDVSVKDIYGALATGATIVLLPRRLFSAPAQLVDALREHKVTVMTWAVAALCLVSSLHGLDHAPLPSVRLVLFSGGGHAAQASRTLARAPCPRQPSRTSTGLPRSPGTAYTTSWIATAPTSTACPWASRSATAASWCWTKACGPLASRTGGELYVGGPNIALGYYADPADGGRLHAEPHPRSVAGNRIPHRRPRAHRRGRELFFSGRADDQINIRAAASSWKDRRRLRAMPRCRALPLRL